MTFVVQLVTMAAIAACWFLIGRSYERRTSIDVATKRLAQLTEIEVELNREVATFQKLNAALRDVARTAGVTVKEDERWTH